MAQAGESWSPRPSLQPISNNVNRWPSAIGRRALASEPLQPSVRIAQALRRPELPLSASRTPWLLASPSPLPSRRTAATAPVRRALPFRQLLPDVIGQHFGGAETQATDAGIHGVAAVVTRIVHRCYSPRRRPEKLQHRFAAPESQRTRT